MTEAIEPKDAAKRIALKEQLKQRMQRSIVEQGCYGVRQTAMWEKVYCRAQRFVQRAYPTQNTLRKLIKQLDQVHQWTPSQDQTQRPSM